MICCILFKENWLKIKTLKRYLAIDFGLKRTGIAVSDENNIIAYGLTTVESKDLMTFLKAQIPKLAIGTIVIGEPKRKDTSDSHVTANVRLLKEALESNFPDTEVVLMDERFTSKMALQSLIQGGVSKKKRSNKALIDEVSATIILQSFMQLKGT